MIRLWVNMCFWSKQATKGNHSVFFHLNQQRTATMVNIIIIQMSVKNNKMISSLTNSYHWRYLFSLFPFSFLFKMWSKLCLDFQFDFRGQIIDQQTRISLFLLSWQQSHCHPMSSQHTANLVTMNKTVLTNGSCVLEGCWQELYIDWVTSNRDASSKYGNRQLVS